MHETQNMKTESQKHLLGKKSARNLKVIWIYIILFSIKHGFMTLKVIIWVSMLQCPSLFMDKGWLQTAHMFHFIFSFKAVTTALAQVDREKIYQWINELSSPETRENALLELSKKRESVPDLAPMLWHSCGTIAALLQVSHENHEPRTPELVSSAIPCFSVSLLLVGNC